jgi:hypothetical protein
MRNTTERYEAPDGPLRATLAGLPDVRRGQIKVHPLGGLLALAVCVLLCGRRSVYVISQWGQECGSPVRTAPSHLYYPPVTPQLYRGQHLPGVPSRERPLKRITVVGPRCTALGSEGLDECEVAPPSLIVDGAQAAPPECVDMRYLLTDETIRDPGVSGGAHERADTQQAAADVMDRIYGTRPA